MVIAALVFVSCVDEAEQHYNAGVELYNQGQLNEAIAEYTKVIELEPEWVAEVYYSRALTHYHLGEYQQAIEDLDETIGINPQDADAYTIRGLAYTALNMDAAAQQDIDRAVELGVDPDLLESWVEEIKEQR